MKLPEGGDFETILPVVENIFYFYLLWVTVLICLGEFACAVKLGLLGKGLLDVILPGKYVPRKKKSTTGSVPKTPIEPKAKEVKEVTEN